jgi:hypothetical protein
MAQAFRPTATSSTPAWTARTSRSPATPTCCSSSTEKTKAEVQHLQIQDGLRLVDELRAADGLGPLPAVPEDWTQEPGKVPQITPVGGARTPPPAPRPAASGP